MDLRLLFASFSTFLCFNTGINNNNYFSSLRNNASFLINKLQKSTPSRVFYTPSFTYNPNLIKLWAQVKSGNQATITLNENQKNCAQKSVYEQQQKLICKIVQDLFNEQDEKTLSNVLPELLTCSAILDKHPQLKKILENQQKAPNMWQLISDINNTPPEELPTQVASLRTSLQAKINEMSLWKKATFATTINKKFTNKAL